MAKLSFEVTQNSIKPPGTYSPKKKSETIRRYAQIELRGGQGQLYRIVFLRPDSLQPGSPGLEESYDSAKKTGISYRLAYEYAWYMDLLAGEKTLTVHLDSANPKANRIEASVVAAPYAPGPVPDLDAWLTTHPFLSGIYWQDAGGLRAYENWTAAEKNALKDAFAKAWLREPLGLADPPVNLAAAVYPNNGTVIGGQDAFALYVAHLAQSLTVEIGGLVPWSMQEYNGTLDHGRIVGMNYMFWWDEAYQGHKVDGKVLPPPPDLGFAFLRNNDLIRSTRLETITTLLEWCRRNLLHVVVYDSWTGEAEQHLAHWGYAGAAPASKTLQGTLAQFPDGGWWGHWTDGCYGTSYFLRAVLRLVNIPVEPRFFNGGHTSAEFTTEGRFMSHGDDPYSGFVKSTPPFNVEEVLIYKSTFDSWFGSGTLDEIQANVGRRPVELAVAHLPDSLLLDYFRDLQEQVSHSESRVFGDLKKVYTLSVLDKSKLWVRLQAKLAAFKGIAQKKKPPKGKPKAKKKPGPPFPKKKPKRKEAKPRMRRKVR